MAGLTDNSIFISLLAVLFFGLSNGASIFSCIIGANAKSPKWAAINILLLQRLGFLLMFISTYAATGSHVFALVIFFVSYGIYGIATGMSGPVYSVLISGTIHRNIPSFYGTYSMIGAFSGVLGAQVLRLVLERYDFPISFRWVFLMGLLVAMLSTLSLAIGISETKVIRTMHFTFSMIPGTVKDILSKNKKYRSFLMARIIAAMADMSIPFFIIYIGSLTDSPESIVGSLTTILLISNMAASKIIGQAGKHYGPMIMLRIAVLAGALASILAVFAPSVSWGFVIFTLVGFTVTGNIISNSVANIHFAGDGYVSFYAMTSGIIIAPFYIVFSFLGGIIASRFSIPVVFIISASLYTASFIMNLILSRRSA